MYEVFGYISTNCSEDLSYEFRNNENLLVYKTFITIKEYPFWVLVYSQKKENYRKNTSFFFVLNDEQIFIIANLHNRSSLLKSFELSAFAHDSEIVFSAYKKAGIKGLKTCYGKWMFLSYHKKNNKIFLARDHLGMFNYYYCFVHSNFYFSTKIDKLLNLKHIRKDHNWLFLAGLAVGYSGNGNETAFNKIYKAPPSTLIEFNENEAKYNKYWMPKFESNIHYANKEDYYLHFLELFSNIVNESIQNSEMVASTLSSGLDSSFVTAVTADILKNKNKPLIAITASPKYSNIQVNSKNRYADEVPLAKLVADKYSNINHIIDHANDIDPISGLIKSLQIHSYPVRNAGNQYWIISMFEKIQQSKADTLLIGQMGNLTYSWPFFNPITPNNYLKKKIKNLFFKKKPFYINNSFLSSSFIKQIQLITYLKNANYYPDYFSNNLNSMRQYFFEQMQNIGYSAWNEKANYFGINIIDPTADVRLIEYCFSLPQYLFKNDEGNRLFIRIAAKNILPYEILTNNKKALQSADAKKRIFEEIKTYYVFLNEVFNNQTAIEMFDVRLLINSLKSQKLSIHVFLRSLLIIIFIYFATNNQEFRITKKIVEL